LLSAFVLLFVVQLSAPSLAAASTRPVHRPVADADYSLGEIGASAIEDATADSHATMGFATMVQAFWNGSDKTFYALSNHKPETGNTRADFWWAAELWEVVLDEYQRTRSTSARTLVDDVYDGFVARHPNFDSPFNDDRGWWALAAVRAYELTGETRYLQRSKSLWTGIWSSWDSSLGGGIWWSRDAHTEKNVATNATAASIAAELYRKTGKSAYRDAALAIVHWLNRKLRSGDHIADHIDANGNVIDWQFTYDYGAYAGAAARLSTIEANDKFLRAAVEVATHATTALTRDGILVDEGTGTGGGFKGIAVRNLALLDTDYGQGQFRAFLHQNGEAAWQHRRSDGLNGPDWATTPGSGGIESLVDSSAVALYEAAAITH
jgi:predicted alpha-1,6-mannanase (GH76 family)